MKHPVVAMVLILAALAIGTLFLLLLPGMANSSNDVARPSVPDQRPPRTVKP
ncbi:MAG: hypothetical protein ACPL7G_01030 [Chloroflexia bacterium]